jgi:hypothetical protein
MAGCLLGVRIATSRGVRLGQQHHKAFTFGQATISNVRPWLFELLTTIHLAAHDYQITLLRRQSVILHSESRNHLTTTFSGQQPTSLEIQSVRIACMNDDGAFTKYRWHASPDEP